MSCNLIYGRDAEIAQWVSEKIGNPDFGPCVSIGIAKNDALIAGVVYSNYIISPSGAPISIEISMAAIDKRWATRHNLRELLSYPFLQLGVQRVQVSTPVESKNVLRINEKLGFVREGIARKAHFLGGDVVVLSMLRNECKWIDNGKVSAKTATTAKPVHNGCGTNCV